MSNPNEDTQAFDVTREFNETLPPTCEGYGPPLPIDDDQVHQDEEN